MSRELPHSLAITAGDPAGVGPDVVSSVLMDPPDMEIGVVLVGSPDVLNYAAGESAVENSSFSVRETIDEPVNEGDRYIWDPSSISFSPGDRGTGTTASGRAGFSYLKGAFSLWSEDRVGGIVTGPVSKQVISTEEEPFYGQTEWLARKLGEQWPIMGMKWNDWLVTLVTRHISVRKIPMNLSEDLITRTIRKTARGLQEKLGYKNPRIGVTGLNPHAGEGGLLGREEEEMISPAVSSFSGEEQFFVEGPRSAESLITEDGFSRCDAVVAMYHDQGLVPLKARGLHECAALTLGLPLVRTSVAHGTAYELAGREEVRDDSLRNAIHLAATMVRHDSRER